jgi:hypothetical protein
MDHKQSIVMGIALQTELLKLCAAHRELFCDEDVDPSMTFAVAAELIRHDGASAQAFQHNVKTLAGLLSEAVAAAPSACPQCATPVAVPRSGALRKISAS